MPEARQRNRYPAGRGTDRGVRNSNLLRLHKICTYQNCHSKIPLLKVLGSLETFFQEGFKQGLGQSPKVFPSPYPIGIKGDQASLQVMPSELAEVYGVEPRCIVKL